MLRLPLTLATIALLTAIPAFAEEAPDRRIMIGTGVQTVPRYAGADGNQAAFLPLFDTWREGELIPVESPDEAFGSALLGSRSGTAIGPAIGFAEGRAADDIPGLPKIGFGIEAGVFAQTFPIPQLRLRAELRQGIGGHKALTGDLAADVVIRGGPGESAVATIGPRLRWGSAKYTRAYFGVPSPAPVFTAYEPGGGIYAVGAVAGLRLPLGRTFGLYGYLGYDRLTGDAANSPIVLAGSRDQYSAGLALTYRFTI
jgi:MipA family protein